MFEGLGRSVTVLIEDPDKAQELLSALRNLGFQIALDDFGTGFSSLSYLQKFAFDALKIDQSFTMNMLTDSSSMQIVKASIGLANALDLNVVAEGVEYKNELAELDAMKSRRRMVHSQGDLRLVGQSIIPGDGQ